MQELFEKWECAKHYKDHTPEILKPSDSQICCSGFWNQNIREGDPRIKKYFPEFNDEQIEKMKREMFPRPVVRKLKGGAHYIGSAPPEEFKSKYHEAVFMILPVTNISVPQGDESSEIAESIRDRTDIPVWEPET
jgi:hypothetical protein